MNYSSVQVIKAS